MEFEERSGGPLWSDLYSVRIPKGIMAEPDTTEATAESATDESMETTSSDADSDSHAVSNSETSDIIQDASFPTLIEPNGERKPKALGIRV